MIAVRRWRGGFSPVSHIVLLLAALMLLLVIGNALEMRTQSNEDMMSFEDAQAAALAVTVNAFNFSDLDIEPNMDAMIAVVSESIEKIDIQISKLQKLPNEGTMMNMGEILNECLPPTAKDVLAEELRLGEYPARDLLEMLDVHSKTLKHAVELMNDQEMANKLLEEFLVQIEDSLTPEMRDLVLHLDKAMTDPDISREDYLALVDEYSLMIEEEVDLKDTPEELLQLLKERKSMLNEEEVCGPPDASHSNGNIPKKGSAWTQKA